MATENNTTPSDNLILQLAAELEKLIERRKALDFAAYSGADYAEEAMERVIDRSIAIENSISAIPATSAAAAIIQLYVSFSFSEHTTLAEKRLICSAINVLRRQARCDVDFPVLFSWYAPIANPFDAEVAA